MATSASKPTIAETVFMFSSSSRLGLKDQDCRFFFVIGWSSDVKAIEFRRPKRGPGAGPRGNPSNLCVVIGVVLLVDEHRANIEASAAGNVHALARCIEIDAIHALNRWKVCNFLARRGVHDNQCRRGAGTDKQPVRGFIKCPIARPLAAHRPRGENLALSSIDDLDLTADRIEYKQRLSGLVHQNLGRAD